jgi:hypothetical protein
MLALPTGKRPELPSSGLPNSVSLFPYPSSFSSIASSTASSSDCEPTCAPTMQNHLENATRAFRAR